MSKKERRSVPVLRFKGFTDDWEQRKWKDILLVNSGKDYKHLSRGSIPVYGTGGYMLSVNKELSNVDAIGIGRKGTIDHPQYLKAPFWTVDTLFFMTPKNDINIDFAFGISRTVNWKKYDESTGLPSLSKKSIDNISIKLPNYDEQIKIGQMISQIDKVISLQQRKLDRLLLLKKAYLTNLLPDKTQNPKVRFKEFNDKWKKLKLGNISSISAGGDVNKQKLLKKGRYPVIANALTNKGVIGYYESEYRIQAPAVTVTGRGDIGHAYARKTNFTPVVRLLSVKSKHNVDFLAEAINQKKVPFESTGVPQLTVPKLSNYKILFPSSITEENKIGNFIIKFDEIINLQNKKISSLEQVKNFLLQNMFI